MLVFASGGIDSRMVSMALKLRFKSVDCVNYLLKFELIRRPYLFTPSLYNLRNVVLVTQFNKLVSQRSLRDIGNERVICSLCNIDIKIALAYAFYYIAKRPSSTGHYIRHNIRKNTMLNSLIFSKSQRYFRPINPHITWIYPLSFIKKLNLKYTYSRIPFFLQESTGLCYKRFLMRKSLVNKFGCVF